MHEIPDPYDEHPAGQSDDYIESYVPAVDLEPDSKAPDLELEPADTYDEPEPEEAGMPPVSEHIGTLALQAEPTESRAGGIRPASNTLARLNDYLGGRVPEMIPETAPALHRAAPLLVTDLSNAEIAAMLSTTPHRVSVFRGRVLTAVLKQLPDAEAARFAPRDPSAKTPEQEIASVGPTLKDKLKAAGMTQTQLEALTGIHQSVISRFFAGKYFPDAEEVLVPIAQALGYEPEQIEEFTADYQLEIEQRALLTRHRKQQTRRRTALSRGNGQTARRSPQND